MGLFRGLVQGDHSYTTTTVSTKQVTKTNMMF
jgi:hypothetical protein